MLRIAKAAGFLISVVVLSSCSAAGIAEEVIARPKTADITGKPFQQPKISSDTFQANVMLVGLLPRAKKPANFELLLTRATGEWRSVLGKAYKYNTSSHPVKNTGLKATEDGLEGTVHITIHPDAWVPEDGKRRDIDVTLKDVTFAKETDERGNRLINGGYTAVIAHPDGSKKEVSGKVVGTVAPFRLPGVWTAGAADGAGIAFEFDMGTDRVNWNHMRCAVQELSQVSDLRGYRGLTCTVSTAKPRDDVHVTLWIRESDGSWYYLRSAVPLIDKVNSATVDFADFAEAEWVSPGSHIDEDYVIDLSQISHIAIGVVNPLGVGEVNFTLEKLKLEEKSQRIEPRVQATCSGKMLSINNHNVVPAPLFGGFAGNMPQQYRPGCQRNLYAQSYPRNPWQDWYKFNTPGFTDWRPLMDIFSGKVEKHAKLVEYLHSRVDDGKFRTRFRKFSLDKHLKSRDGKNSPRDLRRLLDSLLRVKDLYSAEAWKGYELPEKVVADVTRKDKDEVQVYQFNRRLLEATFAEYIKPVPEHGPAEMFYIECYGERKEPAVLVRNPNGWERQLRGWARSLAENSRDFQKYGEVVLEFWNEPYLHWGSKDKINLKNHYYREDLAAENGPVMLKMRPGFDREDIKDYAALARFCRSDNPLGKLIAKKIERVRDWSQYDPDGNDELDDRTREQVSRSLNNLLDSEELAKLAMWKEASLPEPVQSLKTKVAKGEASEYELSVLNRSLLAAALPKVFTPNPALEPGAIIPHLKWHKDAKGNWGVVDETAFTYWSGKGNGWIYDKMYRVIASEVKKHNPQITTLAGWGFRWNEDHWAAWDLLYKNTIDRNIEYIDGIHEHHYQGDVTAMPGAYEVLTAYGVTKHNKWLYSYNTETNDLLDAPSRGNITSSAEARRATEYRRMSYNMRDILYAIHQTPDKARGRTMIHPTATQQALHVGYGLMRNLRGRLVACETSDPDVWMVASVDGTDPNAMPPAFDGTQKLVVIVFNDHRHDRAVDITVAAPTGTVFRDGRAERTHVDKSDYQISRPGEDVQAAGRTELTLRAVPIQGRGAWKIELPLKGAVVESDEVVRKQFFSPDILQVVKRGTPLKKTVAIDPEWLNADRAWLKLVVENVATGEGSVKIGKQTIPLPTAYTADNVNRIVWLEVPVGVLTEKTPVTFQVNQGNHAGYRVDMTSLVLEKRK
ncbi:MAG: hypothetical protein ACLFVU_08530 [Phycisphaerae bacterium]